MRCENDIKHKRCTREAVYEVEIIVPRTSSEPSYIETIMVCDSCEVEFRGLKMTLLKGVDLPSQE